MARSSILTAAQLVEASYNPSKQPDFARRIHKSLSGTHDVEAHFLNSGTLVIPGSNSVADYLKFNLRVLNIGGKRYRVDNLATERAGNMIWHQGFLAHAKEIQDWLKRENLKPVFVIGHSLGAASTQILTKLMNVPGIAFAAPRPRKHNSQTTHDQKCLNINRNDDMVCDLPGSFHHLGTVHLCDPRRSVFGPDHAMKHYRKVVTEQQDQGLLPQIWPR